MHELFEDAATTPVTQLSDFVIQDLCVAHRILSDHAGEQVLAEGVELSADLRGVRGAAAPSRSSLRMVLRSRPVARAISLIDFHGPMRRGRP